LDHHDATKNDLQKGLCFPPGLPCCKHASGGPWSNSRFLAGTSCSLIRLLYWRPARCARRHSPTIPIIIMCA
jgi:hypothetical protein